MTIEPFTVKEISDNIIAQLESILNQNIPLLPKSFLRVLAKVIGAVFVILYKYSGFIFLQIFVQSATNDDVIVNGKTINPLVFWGRLIGIGDPQSATNAELIVDVTALNQTGSLPSGSQLVSQNTGVTYITIGAVLLDAVVVQATARAVSDQAGGQGAGTIGNLDPGAILSFANPLANVARDAIVVSQATTGTEGESTERYRQRVINRFQKKPQGGAYADYEQWADEAAGIINSYPYTGDPGQVNVYTEATVESSGNEDGIPTPAQLESVLDLINFDENGLAARRNANAFVNSLSIVRTLFGVRVLGIANVDDLSQVQTDIEAALDEYFFSVEPFIPGLSILPRNDQITAVRISAIIEDVVFASNGIFTNAFFFLDAGGGNLATYFLGEGEKARLASVVFV